MKILKLSESTWKDGLKLIWILLKVEMISSIYKIVYGATNY